MTIPSCPECGADLGPWDGSRCLRHTKASWRSIADHATIVLENDTGPIYLHDIQRGIARDAGALPDWSSVSAVVGADRRFCWSGKGLDGLFRHGRLPWVRTLADTAGFVLLAADQPLSSAELGFFMKWSGYRFQENSLAGALSRYSTFIGGWEPARPWSPAAWKMRLADRADERARYPPSGWPVDELLTRWASRVDTGLRERARRLGDVDVDIE